QNLDIRARSIHRKSDPPDAGTKHLAPVFEDYAFMLEDACAAWGFDVGNECSIYTLMGDVGLNAFATKCDRKPVIIYNRDLTAIVGGDGAEFIIAHELGHHFCKHLDFRPATPG